MSESIFLKISKIAKFLSADGKWVKFNSKSQKQGWKRKKDGGGFEYRYQDNDPNKENSSVEKKAIEDLKKTSVFRDIDNFGEIIDSKPTGKKGIYQVTIKRGYKEKYEVETSDSELGVMGIKNKILANRLYKTANVLLGPVFLSEFQGKPAIFTEKEDTSLDTPELKENAIETSFGENFRKGFIIDVLLGNNNVLGNNFQNVEIVGGVVRRDNKHTLLFREGGIDSLSDQAVELYDFRDKNKYPQLAKFYSKIRDDEIIKQISKTAIALNDDVLADIVTEMFPSPEESEIAKKLIDKLIKRKKYLLDFAKVKAVEMIQEKVLKRKEKYIVGPGIVEEKTMTTAEAKSIRNYSDTDYMPINKYLRGELNHNEIKETPFETEVGIKDACKTLVQALQKLPAHEGIVYRGSEVDEASLISIMGMKPGDSIYMKSFTSTSKSESNALEFSTDVLFEIESRTGRDISHMSEYPTEEEVIMSPDTRYEVKSMEFEQEYIRLKLKELLPEEGKTRLSVNLKKNKKMDPNEVRKFLLKNPKLTRKQRERIMRLNPDQLIKIILAIFSKKGNKVKEESNKFTEIFI